MRDKKLQVFVSSTFTDLRKERQAAVEAILSCGHIPAGMELFSAGDESQMTVIKRWINESDVYLLILGGRYGSIEPQTGKSYIHLEYEYAIRIGKPLFAVVITDEALEKKVREVGSSVKEDENPKELRAFKQQVKDKMVRPWEDEKDIKLAIHETLAEFGYRIDLVGWIRGDNAINTAAVTDEIARLSKENAELRSRLDGASNNALYVGFTFDELATQLKREKYIEGDSEYDAYYYLCVIGQHFIDSRSLDIPTSHSGINILHKYKLVIREPWDGHGYWYQLTDDGHAFYLKTLYYKEKNDQKE